MKYFQTFRTNWREFLKNRSDVYLLSGGILFLSLVVLGISNFFGWNEARPGTVIPDPVLALFEPIDLTWITFIVLYGILLVIVLYMLPRPKILLFAAYGYGLLVAVRMATMFLLPLEAPPSIIPLEDPFIAIIGGGVTLQKDLFFSGHTGTSFFFFLILENKLLKYIMLAVTIIIGSFVLLQHVHYSIDVFSAPFFTFAVFSITRKFVSSYLSQKGII
ncbi:MAG: hypothetical protein SCALA702_10450 [Melioribacteraceae bacterium]|nr:MAG: hypothetical protein SCALA702_10450 [Melioribacteraceae bacterium]